MSECKMKNIVKGEMLVGAFRIRWKQFVAYAEFSGRRLHGCNEMK